ncbi:MAG: 30S ribosomal protein S8e [Candidatus Methanoperedens sp.]|nr:30S ribosomal protein S8e [Candidatus Methanoperedens sp.]MCE8426302.1 30S ribosomal protein S8e [Candidatus Methanoperedens sp.]MCE8428566.1 30S ribosomal protein S8e [Candidatus Methanoperedens sp.]
MRWQGKSTRKFTSGRIIRARGKRRYELGGEEASTHLGDRNLKTQRSIGGKMKVRLLRDSTAIVMDPKTKTSRKVTIETVSGNPANIHYVRRNIMTKGAIIKTEIGQARITNRPGQEGSINAILIVA